MLERLIEARFSRERQAPLRAANLDLDKLRFLLRLCHDKRHLSHGGYKDLMDLLDEAGRMIGGWSRHTPTEP